MAALIPVNVLRKLPLLGLLLDRRPRFARAAARLPCAIDGSLMMMDRIVSFPGRVIDLSMGGALFRPRLAYLLNRRDVPVCLSVGGEELFGTITGTSPKGFGIHFDEPLTEAEFAAILSRGGDNEVVSPLAGMA